MSVTIAYDDTAGAVTVTATGLGSVDYATVEHSLDQVTWTTGRGGANVAVAGGAFSVPLVVYDGWAPGVVNYYRVRGVSTAPIAYVAKGGSSTGSSGSRTPTAPAGIVAGDLLLCLASTRNSGTGTVDTPAGWYKVVDGSNVALLGKVYDGSEAMPTVTFTGGAANEDTIAVVAAFRNAAVVPVTGDVQLNSAAQNVAFPALPIRQDNLAVLVGGWKQDDWTSVTVLAGFSSSISQPSTAGNDAQEFLQYQIQTTAADIAAGSVTVTGGTSAISRSFVVALEQAPYVTEQTASITPIPTRTWIKSVAQPYLSTPVDAVSVSPAITRPARAGVFDVVSQSAPIPVADIRESRQWTMLVRTESAEDADQVGALLAVGDVLYVQATYPCEPAVPSGYVTVGDVSYEWHPLRPLRRLWTLPLTEVAAPSADVVGSPGTWSTVLATYGSWTLELAGEVTWADLLAGVGAGTEVPVA